MYRHHNNAVDLTVINPAVARFAEMDAEDVNYFLSWKAVINEDTGVVRPMKSCDLKKGSFKMARLITVIAKNEKAIFAKIEGYGQKTFTISLADDVMLPTN